MLELRIPHLPLSLKPTDIALMEHFLLLQCISQTLVRINENGDIVGDLAESWRISNSGKSYRFKIKNSFSHSGKLITAHDVALSISQHFWGKSVVSVYMEGIIVGTNDVKSGDILSGINVISEKEFQIELVDAYPPFLYVLAMPGFSVSFNGNSSGPFKIAKKENFIRLERNKNYRSSRIDLKSINVSSASGVSEVMKLFLLNKIDISLGNSLIDIEKMKDIPDDISITKTESLAFAHFYYNMNRKIFKDIAFRKDLSLFFQDIANKNKTGLHEFSPFFIPKGVMPAHYYKRKKEDFDLKKFAMKWKKFTSGKKLRVVVMSSVFSDLMLNELKSLLKDKLGLQVEMIKATNKSLMEILKSDSYDIVGGRYVGNFPDPDGFVGAINQNSSLHYGVFPTEPLFDDIFKVRHTKSPRERLEKYTDILIEFEKQWYFAPLYRLKIPIIHRKDIVIPETNFRYESELWKIFWNE